ncbi:MAG: hypothetical protein ABIV48_06785 [Pyrinomonadaceae bacterium]
MSDNGETLTDAVLATRKQHDDEEQKFKEPETEIVPVDDPSLGDPTDIA